MTFGIAIIIIAIVLLFLSIILSGYDSPQTKHKIFLMVIVLIATGILIHRWDLQSLDWFMVLKHGIF